MSPVVSPEAGTPCSVLSARRGLPLIGSAGCYDAILAFELDAPWTPRLIGSRASDARLDAAMDRIATQHRNVRLLALEPDGGRNRGRVLWLFREPGGFRAFARREFEVSRSELPVVLERMARSEEPGAREVDGHDRLRDILVCTHGSRDACCGKLGYPLYRQMRELAQQRADAGAPVRVWRSSHLGGHRFAPTLLDLPAGRMFGRLDAADAAVVFGGGAPLVERLDAIYRGCCALPEAAQIVERQLWQAMGAAFEHATRLCTVEASERLWQVDLDARCDDGRQFATRARVTLADVDAVATPASCGRDPEPEVPWKILA